VAVSEFLGSSLDLASKQIKLHIVHKVLSLNGVFASVPDLREEVAHKHPLSNQGSHSFALLGQIHNPLVALTAVNFSH
jgi:hypothetical protein